MEKMNLALLGIIALYLMWSYVKSGPAKGPETNLESLPDVVEEDHHSDYEQHVLAAVIAAVMQDRGSYRIRRVYVTEKEEKHSSWKFAGRQQSMMRGPFLR
jgi:hypothetical protein